jgi:hypothetical protein
MGKLTDLSRYNRRFRCPPQYARESQRFHIGQIADLVAALGAPAKHGTFHCMGLMEAGAWGLAGGLAAGLIILSGAVISDGFRWPWHIGKAVGGSDKCIWPHMFVFGVGLVVGTLVAAAAHQEMSGDWPAFLMGVGAPSVVRGAIGHVQVAERKSTDSEIVG